METESRAQVVQVIDVAGRPRGVVGFELPPWGWDLRQRPEAGRIEVLRWRDVPERYRAELDDQGIVRWRRAA